jgi:hypothetical protein
MTNTEIILMEQATRGITEELHTFQKWKSLGFKVKKNEHGIETRLWKFNPKNKEEMPEDADEETKKKYKNGFYLAKSYLFKQSQVEKIEEK